MVTGRSLAGYTDGTESANPEHPGFLAIVGVLVLWARCAFGSTHGDSGYSIRYHGSHRISETCTDHVRVAGPRPAGDEVKLWT